MPMIKPRKRKTPEASLKKAVRDYASYIGGMRIWSIIGGIGQSPGIADFLGVYKGKALAIECKTGKNLLTVHQQKFKEEWEYNGGIYIECRDVKDIAIALGLNTDLW